MSAASSVKIFTDGACSGNPGPGGWGAIVAAHGGRIKELGGGAPRTTNNRMELQAAIEALRYAAGEGASVDLYTDSSYVIHGIKTWLAGWRRRDWKRPDGSEVLNRDLWEDLDAAARTAGRVSWHYVRGHDGTPGNERCDEIAVSYSKGRPETLYDGDAGDYGFDLSRLPEDLSVPEMNPSRSSKPKGGTYLSFVDGVVARHATWSECDARVRGKSRARFKKVQSPEEEARTLKGWGL